MTDNTMSEEQVTGQGRSQRCEWAGPTDPIKPCVFAVGHEGPHSYMPQPEASQPTSPTPMPKYDPSILRACGACCQGSVNVGCWMHWPLSEASDAARNQP